MSKKKRTFRRVLFTVLGVAVALILVAALAVVVVLRGPLPKHSGEVILSGPRAEIRVLRDDRAVPHIYATTDHDLFDYGLLVKEAKLIVDTRGRLKGGENVVAA